MLGRIALASTCGIFIFRDATQLSTRPAPYAFESTVVGTKALTKWPACSTIYYSVELGSAPRNAAAVIARDTALAHRITGLAFHRIETGAPPSFVSYDTSGHVAPVIFAWVGADQLFGQKNVNAVTVPIVNALRTHYTSGIVLFNDDMNAAFQTDPKFANNLVLHELGHVLGLADVDNASAVMNYYLQPGTAIGSYASGDVTGLHRLYPSVCRAKGISREWPVLGTGPHSGTSGLTYRTALQREETWE
ncbi:MAG: matrixin family metalloprotease [Acidobacteriota bacterium]|nr:matrixin family metalloprotease [Acidobacteriota bacterium]MDE3082619.1 matrixin family metalloprotease [Acidobacteriota bacterium]